MPTIKRKKGGNDGAWVPAEEVDLKPSERARLAANPKRKKVFKVVTVWGRKQREWLDSNLWQPRSETVIPEEAKAPLTIVYYGTYGSDGMRRDGAPGGAYSSVFDQYKMQGGDVYMRDEQRRLDHWDTRKPFPGFDPKLGSKTLDIYSED